MVSKPANALNLSSVAGVVLWDGSATLSTTAITQYDVLVGGTSNAISSISPTSNVGYVLTSNGLSANPSFQAAPGGSITITGDTGGGLTGSSFTFTGGTTGLTFAGATSTETLGGMLVVTNGGTGAATLTGVLTGNGTSAITANTVTQYGTVIAGASNAVSSVAPSATSGVPYISQGASANPTFGTAVVAGGGTGVATMTTAYAPVCAGMTATGALQVAATGLSTSGYVLTSNGASALPSFKVTPSSSFTVNIQTFTYTGGVQTYTPTSGMTYAEITCLGVGGAGGGAAIASSKCSGGSGGGAGEYAIGMFSAASIGASQAVTIGAAGIGNSGATGGNGGNTSVGSLISAYGGSGGITYAATASSYNVIAGAGGTGGSGGNFRTPGMVGSNAFCMPIASSFSLGGTGANSQYGSGGQNSYQATGGAALGYGSGGGGTANTGGGSAYTGGAGTAGIVVIREYIAIGALIPAVSWTDVTGTSAAMVGNHGYVADNVGLVTLTLPTTAAFGDIIYIVGKGTGLWSVAQNSGQTIHINASSSTTGAGGSMASTSQYNYAQIICTVANTDFTVMMNEGILTLT